MKKIIMKAHVISPLAIAIVFCAVLLAVYSTDRAEKITLSNYQLTLINQASIKICQLDEKTCNQIKKGNIQYKAIVIPSWLRPLNLFNFNHQAVTFQREGHYEVQLADVLFDDLNAITVFLYHEVQHIAYSDFALYSAQPTYLTSLKNCLDHNKVKMLTLDFAIKLDELEPVINDQMSHIDYALLWGNEFNSCS